MQQHGARRLVVTSMMGVGESKANSSFFLRLLVATFLRGADKDKAAMESEVKTSNLDWVILRPSILTDGSVTGNVRVFRAETGENADKMTRGDLAAFMVAQLTSDQYLHQTVSIGQ